MNLIEAQFTNRDVLRALPNLHPDVFQDLVNRRLIQPESERNPGYGKKRLYSAENILQLALVHALLDAGLTPALAVEMCDRNMMLSHFRPTGKIEFQWRVRACVGGDSEGRRNIYTRDPGRHGEPDLSGLIKDAEENGFAAIVLPVQKIQETTLARLEQILAEREADNE